MAHNQLSIQTFFKQQQGRKMMEQDCITVEAFD